LLATLEKADWNNTTIIKDAANEIPKLKKEGDGNLLVFGSGELSASLIKPTFLTSTGCALRRLF
jgi:dihydrofolate reductase